MDEWSEGKSSSCDILLFKVELLYKEYVNINSAHFNYYLVKKNNAYYKLDGKFPELTAKLEIVVRKGAPEFLSIIFLSNDWCKSDLPSPDVLKLRDMVTCWDS